MVTMLGMPLGTAVNKEVKLILVHGSGSTGEVWKYQNTYFPDSEAVNLPGHPVGKPCTSVLDYTYWLHDYISKRGYKGPVLAGHSLGGAIVQTYALEYPNDAGAIILIGTGARLRVTPDFLALLEAGIANPAKWLREFVEPHFAKVPADLKETIIKRTIEVGAAVQLNDFLCCDKFDIMDKVHTIKLPTLVLCGSDDIMTPIKYSQYLATKISGSKLVIINGGTHFVFMEKPDAVNQAIKQFLSDLVKS